MKKRPDLEAAAEEEEECLGWWAREKRLDRVAGRTGSFIGSIGGGFE